MKLVSGKSFIVLNLLIAMFLVSCNDKTNDADTEIKKVELDEQTVTAFAYQIVQSVNNGNPSLFNDAFDKKYIQRLLSDNSIVYSSFDTDRGKMFFDLCFRLGDVTEDIINNGGDFTFLRHYVKDGQHHIIFRTYANTEDVRFDDYIVDTVDNQLKIKDGFRYNNSSSLSHEVEYSMLLNILVFTEPEGVTSQYIKAVNLLMDGKKNEAFLLFDKNKELYKDYPIFTLSYLQTAYDVHPEKFIKLLESYDSLDNRTVLLHKLLYYSNKGDVKKSEETITQLIELTGDDPIYLFLYANANFIAGKYDDALTCLDNIGSALPPIWDLWHLRLLCYEKKSQADNFLTTIAAARDLYGMTDNEILELTETDFPKWKEKVKMKLSESKSK